MQISELPTPALVLDLDRIESNCAAMAERAHALGVSLRPHMKTHKCVEIGELQVQGHFGGITVSTLAEARHFRNSGFEDITLAVPIAPARAAEAISLKVNLLVDSTEAVDAIEASAAGDAVRVYLKVDCGYGRAGVVPDSEGALALARRLSEASVIDFRGLLTHGGQSYDCVDAAGILAVAQTERDVVVGFAQRLRAENIAVDEVSLGSTPTMMHVDHLEGVTEMRPGNYALFDGFQAAIGSCRPEDVAVSVLSTVTGAYDGRVILDVGATALSKDPGPTHVDPDCGFGVITGLDLEELSNLKLVGLSQEHGKAKGAGASALQVGDMVRIRPNHSCLTMACFPEAHVARGTELVGQFRPCRGW